MTIILPNGDQLFERSPDVDRKLSSALAREVRLVRTPSEGDVMYRAWPDVADLAPAEAREAATQLEDGITAGPLGLLAPMTFFDAGPVHVIFASSLRRLAQLSGTDADPRRFRPNVVIDDDDSDGGFVEDELIGAELVVGEALLRLDCPTPRCIVPTLPLSDLPPNVEVLRALARHHRLDVGGLGRFACLGAYASIVREGTVHLGDPVRA